MALPQEEAPIDSSKLTYDSNIKYYSTPSLNLLIISKNLCIAKTLLFRLRVRAQLYRILLDEI